jgi:hypothetical protein
MKSVGSFLILIGIAAIVMHFFHYVPRVLFWIYQWGEGVAWGIKIGLVVIGVLLYAAAGGNKQPQKQKLS